MNALYYFKATVLSFFLMIFMQGCITNDIKQPDENLRTTVQKKIDDPAFKGVGVKVDGRQAFLSGTVETSDSAANLVYQVAAIPDVEGVDLKDLKIAYTNYSISSDTKISTNVKAKLANDRKYKFNNIDVTTVEAVVILKGTIFSKDMESSAVSIAKNTQGVKYVISKLHLIQ